MQSTRRRPARTSCYTVEWAELIRRMPKLEMLTPSFPNSVALSGFPVCLARFQAARLWFKDESLEDSGIRCQRSEAQRGLGRIRAVFVVMFH
jgi:hypothetical protein